MKKIIKRKLYNTETANYIASHRSDRNWTDFSYFEEELYQKKTKEFFLYGTGGPASRYAEVLDDGGRISGRNIIPLSEDEARYWVEKNMDADSYVELFGECEE